MALPQQYLPAFTQEQYLELERASEMRHEFLDGLMYAMAGESPDHSSICFNLMGITGFQIRDSNFQGFSPNMKVRAGTNGLFAYPDLVIVSGEPRFHDEHGDVLGNPCVIFEILSPSTEKYDRGEKFRRYQTQIDSLQDYVMVAQDRAHIESHHREADGSWSVRKMNGLDSVLVLTSIDCRLPLSEVYRNTKVAK